MRSKIMEQDDTFFLKLLTKLSCFSDKDFINPQTTLTEYIEVYSRIAFNFLLLIIIFLCGFIGFNFGGRQFKVEDDFGQYFGSAIWGLSLIFVLYNFTNKSKEVCDRLYIIYNILVDIYFAVLVYDTNYQEKSYVFYIRILYFYMLSATIFLLYRYQTSIKELIIFIAYKFIGLIILILVNNHTKYYIDFVFEFGFLLFWVISLFIYKQLREDYLLKSVEFFTEQKYENQYYQGLINMINKSFLSLNITNYSLTFNNPFENFLKMLGLNEEEIEINLKDQNKFSKFSNQNFNSNNNFNNQNNQIINNFNTNNNDINNLQEQNQNVNNQNLINKSNNNNNNNNNFTNTANVSNINLNVNDFNSNNVNNNMLLTAQGQRLEMTTQNDINNSNNNFNSNSNLNFNGIFNSNGNLNNVINTNSLAPFNRNLNNQLPYNKLDSNSKINSFVNQSNNINNFSNFNLNLANNNNNNNNNNRFSNGNNSNNLNLNNLERNNNNNNINNLLNSSAGKNSITNSSNNNINKNSNNNNFANNFTFLNQANNNLKNNLNPRNTDRVFINNTNAPLNNNINNNNNQNINMDFNQNQQFFANGNNNNNFNINGKLNKNIIFKGKKINDEDAFINKLDYILNVFVNFYEEPNSELNSNELNNLNLNQSPNQQKNFNLFNPSNSSNKTRRNMSEAIREIFYSRYKIDFNDGFIYKGIYSTLPTFPSQMTVELYYRKILTYQGEIVEFYFNDITTTRVVETEKVLNKIRSLVLAKISYEFKVPLITIIYILKNYLNSKNFKSDNTPNDSNIRVDNNDSNSRGIVLKPINNFKNNISAEDFIRNTIDLGDYMLSLINDIIDYSIINSEFDFKCEFENFEFKEMMEFSFRLLKILLTCKGLSDSVVPILEIDSRIPQFFCNDEKRIKQILINLITNSIKFTKKGYIKLSAFLLEEGLIKISVEDTGCGIEPEIVQSIFNDIYTPVVNSAGNFQKTTSGLGLSISKKIIDKIGNKIECSSIVNQKTIFSFVLSSKEDLFENNFDKNDNLSYIDDNIFMNRSGFTTSYIPNINGNNASINNFDKNNNNNFNNNLGNINNFNNNNNNNNSFTINSIRKDNITIKKTNLSERTNVSQFDRMKAAMNINSKRQGSPGINIKQINRRNSNSEIYYFNGNNNNNNKNLNNKSNFNNTNLTNNINNNYNNQNLFMQTAGYEEDVTIIQSPKDIPADLDEIAQNNKSIAYNNKKEFFNRNENYELNVYIKPIFKYFETQKSNIILYVDDSEILRKSVKRQILSYLDLISDCDVVSCKDGAEAFYLLYIDQISNNKIKMIISDDKMDLVNGDELYKSIDKYVENGKIRRIPFVLLDSQNKATENLKKINEFYYTVKKNPKKENVLKLLEIAKIK